MVLHSNPFSYAYFDTTTRRNAGGYYPISNNMVKLMTREKEIKSTIEIKMTDESAAVFKLPQNCSSDDAKYILDVLHLMLRHQYGIN